MRRSRAAERALHMPPLYLPRKFLHWGHLCVTVFRESMQQGMHEQGHKLKEMRKLGSLNYHVFFTA